MQLIRTLYQYIRDLWHHVNTDRLTITELKQPVSVFCSNIPQDNCPVAFYCLLFYCLHAFPDINTFCNMIFVLSGRKLLQDILDRPFSINKQHLPRWEHPAVKPVADQVKDKGGQELHKGCCQEILRFQPPAIHQGDLQIGDHIDKQQRKQLGHKYIHGFQITDLQSAIGTVKEKEQHEINGKHSQMSVLIELQPQCKLTDDGIIILHPYISIYASLQQKSCKRKP